MAFSELNYLHSGGDGRFGSTAREQADALLEALDGADRIVLHFHGGLVPEDRGMAIARDLYPTYADAGAHPVFFVWSSGLWEVVSGNLREIFDERLFQRLLQWLLKFAVGKVLQPGGARSATSYLPRDLDVHRELARRAEGGEPYRELSPADVADELSDEEEVEFARILSADTTLQADYAAVLASVLPDRRTHTAKGVTYAVEAAEGSLLDPAAVAELAQDTREVQARGLFESAVLVKKAVAVLRRVVHRFRVDTDHGVYCTVVEELLRELYLANAGGLVWSIMKQETHDTFDPGPDRVGTYFLDGFARLLGSGQRPAVTLVGHSTGAVFIGNLLLEAARRREAGVFPEDFRFRDVVFLAPASTPQHFAPVAGLHGTLFERFRMFTMTDEHETKAGLPVGYPRSLLYFISGALETDPETGASAVSPLVGLHRWMDGDRTLDDAGLTVRQFLAADPDRVVWSPEDRGSGLASGAVTHGGFDDDAAVRASLTHIIRS